MLKTKVTVEIAEALKLQLESIPRHTFPVQCMVGSAELIGTEPVEITLTPSNESRTNQDYLIDMCNQIIQNVEDWPEHKAHRWIGYIQGVMVDQGVTTVEEQASLIRDLLPQSEVRRTL